MYNKVILLGNLTRDPEVRYTKNGVAVCNFGLATNRTFKDKEETYFGEIIIWGRQGEVCGAHLKKGRTILVDGWLTNSQWEEHGVKKSRTRITADHVKFVGGAIAKPEEPATPNEEEGGDDDDSQRTYNRVTNL